jgi:hypothetical protein
MAHQHIEVSEEWRLEILKQLAAADLFIAILSANYYASIWCKQESGIAAFRGMTVIPLSIDDSIPQGFIAHIQSTRIDPQAPTLRRRAVGDYGTRARHTFFPLFGDEMPMPVAPQRRIAQAGMLAQIMRRPGRSSPFQVA